MKAEVIKPFFDLETGLGPIPENTYHVGDLFEGTAERVSGLVERGFVRKLPTRKKAAQKKSSK